VGASGAILALGLTAPCVFTLRFLAARHPSAGALEVVLAGAALAASVAAHREGMVHLPHAVGDLAWTRGLDPTVLFLALGGGGLVLLAALLLGEERGRRIPRHLAFALLAALPLVAVVRLSGLPEPRLPEELGLTGEAAAAPREAGQRDANQIGELVFRDEYRSGGGQAPVAVVVLRADYEPPSGVYYFRQSAFSYYNGRRLVQATRDDVDRDVILRFPSGRTEISPPPPASDRRAVVPTTTGLLVDHVRPFALDAPVLLEPQPNAAGLRFQRVYDGISLAPAVDYDELLGAAPGSSDWGDSEWAHYTAAPADPRYAEAARAMLEGLAEAYRDDPLARAFAVKRELERSGTYSLKSHHADAEDPVASFLFGDRTGYCVHFAHAAVYLLRALGVPSRVAAGYAVAAADRGGGSSVLIRGLDAHAWPEIHLDGVGWVVVDIAPERVLDAIAPRPDPALQSMLGELLRGTPADEAFAAEDPLAWPRLQDVARVLGALAAAAFALAALVKVERRLAPRFARPHALPRLLYRRALDQLADAGVLRRFGETRERFADRIGGRAPSFARLTRLHLAGALGGAVRSDPGDLRDLGRAIARETSGSTPAWRRLFALVNPFSWLLVR
jgi:transglutaminase-like putative cysteine protease